MTPTAPANLPLMIEPAAAPDCPDLSAATGILVAVAISAVFWIATGYALETLIG